MISIQTNVTRYEVKELAQGPTCQKHNHTRAVITLSHHELTSHIMKETLCFAPLLSIVTHHTAQTLNK